nr:uncharacterized protein LOC127303794 [Lolium perenne]
MRSEPRRTDKKEVSGRTQAQEGRTARAHQTQIGPKGPRPEPASPRRLGAISGRLAPPAASVVAVIPVSSLPPPAPSPSLATRGNSLAMPPATGLGGCPRAAVASSTGAPPRHEAATPLPRQPPRPSSSAPLSPALLARAKSSAQGGEESPPPPALGLCPAMPSGDGEGGEEQGEGAWAGGRFGPTVDARATMNLHKTTTAHMDLPRVVHNAGLA